MNDAPSLAQLFQEAENALFEAAFRTDDFTAADALFTVARERAAAAGDRAAEADAIYDSGLMLQYRAIPMLLAGIELAATDIAAEEELFRQALTIQQELGNEPGIARAAFGLGLVMQVLRGDWTSAMPFFWQALGYVEAVEEAGDLYSCSEFHRHVGFYYLGQDVRLDEAVRHLGISLEFRKRLGDPRLIPSALTALADAELAAGYAERAVDLYTRAIEDSRAAGLLPARIEMAEHGLRNALQAIEAEG